jgi:hypothetical protein
MSNKKWALLASLGLLVFAPLLLIDWAMIIHVISHIMQLGGIELYAVAGIFIFAITVLPVIGVSPALTARINKNRYCRWTNREVDKEGNAFIGFAILIFVTFATTFLIMSVSNPERFIASQNDPIAAMFPEAFSGIVANITTSENATLAAWITGLLPFFTTLISFAVYALICMDKKRERLEQEIQVCVNEIAPLEKECASISNYIENAGSELVLLDNITDGINEIQHNINEFVANKTIHLQQIKDEQRQECDTAQKAVEKKIWSDFREFYDCGITKLAPIQKGDPEAYKKLKREWEAFCQEMREKIATEMSSTWGAGQSYAAMVVAPRQQKIIKRGA